MTPDDLIEKLADALKLYSREPKQDLAVMNARVKSTEALAYYAEWKAQAVAHPAPGELSRERLEEIREETENTCWDNRGSQRIALDLLAHIAAVSAQRDRLKELYGDALLDSLRIDFLDFHSSICFNYHTSAHPFKVGQLREAVDASMEAWKSQREALAANEGGKELK